MRRMTVVVLALALLAGQVGVAAAITPAAQSEPALDGAALVPDTYGGFVGMVGGRQLPQNLLGVRMLLGGSLTDPDDLIQQLVAVLFPDSNIDYAADIAPWLGESLAFGVNSETDWVAVVATADTARSDSFIQKLIVYLGGEGVQFTPIIHEGVVVYASSATGLTAVNGHVVYGALEGVKGVIDVSAGRATSIAETGGFLQVADGLGAGAAVSLYLSGEALRRSLAEQDVDISPLLGEVQVTGMGMALSTAWPTSRLNLAMGWSEPVDGPVMNTPTAGSLFTQALPADSLGFYTSYDVRWPVQIGLYIYAAQTYFQATLSAIDEGRPTPDLPTAAQLKAQADGVLALASLTLSRQLGVTINLEQNVLQWLSGEYGVALLRNPTGQSLDPRLPVDFALMAQVIDRNATLNTVEILSRVVASELGLTPVLVNIGGYDLRAVPGPAGAGNMFVFGIVDEFLVLATGTGIDQIVSVANEALPSLAESEAWVERAADIAPATEGVLYLPVSDIVDYLRTALTGELLETFETANAPALEPLDYALVTADMRDGDVWSLSVVIEMR